MYESLGATPDGHEVVARDANYTLVNVNKDLVERQLAQAIRLAQKNKVAVDYRSVMAAFDKQFGVNHPDVVRLKNLIANLEATNPYR